MIYIYIIQYMSNRVTKYFWMDGSIGLYWTGVDCIALDQIDLIYGWIDGQMDGWIDMQIDITWLIRELIAMIAISSKTWINGSVQPWAATLTDHPTQYRMNNPGEFARCCFAGTHLFNQENRVGKHTWAINFYFFPYFFSDCLTCAQQGIITSNNHPIPPVPSIPCVQHQ